MTTTDDSIGEKTRTEFDRLFVNEQFSFKQMEMPLQDKVNEQLLGFRKDIKTYLSILLAIEVAFLMLIVICQGFRIMTLNNWFLSIFANVCLLQTFFLIKWVVSHIFPSDPQKMGWMK